MCKIRPPRESGTMGPIEMPFGTFDYLGDITKFPKFHRASPIERAHEGAECPARFLSFLMLLLPLDEATASRALLSYPGGRAETL